MATLKKCPFCGGKAIKSKDNSYVECTKCGAKIDYFACGKADAIAVWNRRAEPTFTKEELEFIMLFCNEYEVGECPSILRKCEAALKGGCYGNGK